MKMTEIPQPIDPKKQKKFNSLVYKMLCELLADVRGNRVSAIGIERKMTDNFLEGIVPSGIEIITITRRKKY